MSRIRLAIAGVGNCANSLIQGLEYAGHHFVGIDLHRHSIGTPVAASTARFGGRVARRSRPPAQCASARQRELRPPRSDPGDVSALVLAIVGACSGNPAG